VINAMALGAHGFLLKDQEPEDVLAAVRNAAIGQSTYALQLVGALNAETRGLRRELLTPMEWKVMALAAQGLSNKEIGPQLNIGTGTAKTHLHHVFQKLGVKNRTALAALVVRQKNDPQLL